MPEDRTFTVTHTVTCYCGHYWQYPCRDTPSAPTSALADTCSCGEPKICPSCGQTAEEALEKVRGGFSPGPSTLGTRYLASLRPTGGHVDQSQPGATPQGTSQASLVPGTWTREHPDA